MEVIKLSDALRRPDVRKAVVEAMRRGDVLVYPTDTIYGIGCNADVLAAVGRIKAAKGREGGKSFSVIAPSKDWIWEHCCLSDPNMLLADRMLPGPYTLVLKARPNAPKAVLADDGSIGVRIPRHAFVELVSEAGVPFVTTSVNLSGQAPVSSIGQIPQGMVGSVDIAIDAGRLEGASSRVFDLRTDSVSILRH